MSDLELAYNALNGKKADYDRWFAYYDGDHPLTYLNSRLKDIFSKLDVMFVENWCAVVIDSVKDRINLTGFTAPAAAQAALDGLVRANELLLESDDVHEAALVTGEAFVIAWPDKTTNTPQAYFNDPRLCHVFYEAENPRQKKFAAKWWVGEDGKLHLTLYYPNRLEYYVSQQKAENVSSAAALMPDTPPTAGNPYGAVPVFHFRPARRAIKSDLTNVIPPQNGINKLLTDMMVAAEYGAFKQRYIISGAETNGKVKNAPNEIWALPGGDGVGQDTAVGEFSATDLNNYLQAIDNLVNAVSSITHTPKHYFVVEGGQPSGEALIAQEAPLNKKAQDRIDRFAPVWQDVAAFLLKLAGVAVEASEIVPLFDKPETVQPRTLAEITKIRRDSGVPLESALRMEGQSQTEIDQVMADKQAEAQTEQANLAQSMLEAQRRFDSGQGQATNNTKATNKTNA